MSARKESIVVHQSADVKADDSSATLPAYNGKVDDRAVNFSSVNVFDDDELAQHYMPREDYEGRHRFDPKFQWTAEEEKKLVRKIDKRIMAFVCVMFFALQLDRGNINQALADNFLTDNGFNTNDYNYGQTIFLVSFLSAELPSQVISKRLGPDNWIPVQMVLWSIVATAQAWIGGNKGAYFATRCLLGLLEGGFIPDTVLYLSYFYNTAELPVRLSYFWTSYQMTNVISAFLAFGILRLRGVNGWHGWQWLFALEGILTLFIGIFSYFYLPPSPTQTASYFRGKNGWFSEREETIMVTRILRDDPSKGDMHNRQGLTFRKMWRTLKDFDLYPIYIVGFTWLIPNAPPSSYLTLIVRSMKFDTYTTTLLTVPSSILFIIQLLLWTRISEHFNDKTIISMINQVWNVTLLLALNFMPETANVWARFAVLTMLVGHPYLHAVIVAWTSRNAGSVRTRTIASAFYNMSVQVGSIIGSNIYREDDKPFYHRGNRVLLGIACMNFFVFIGVRFYYVKRNAWKKARWTAMTPKEQQEYLRNTTDQGNKRLDFRFAY
ncbi:hypothetical protein HK097_009122 [Rhizophlyctis rosea]|uniref:Major facilitator superfamily (MFS) profile domain-containing protein n=1 Tax=Rhizophlyctis rosea TaxID=64517 RepID=A0AAD5SKY2_9FUNG|nr:hypothetical protein HK097_009122 [Rhizophlyctis rosea]